MTSITNQSRCAPIALSALPSLVLIGCGGSASTDGTNDIQDVTRASSAARTSTGRSGRSNRSSRPTALRSASANLFRVGELGPQSSNCEQDVDSILSDVFTERVCDKRLRAGLNREGFSRRGAVLRGRSINLGLRRCFEERTHPARVYTAVATAEAFEEFLLALNCDEGCLPAAKIYNPELAT